MSRNKYTSKQIKIRCSSYEKTIGLLCLIACVSLMYSVLFVQVTNLSTQFPIFQHKYVDIQKKKEDNLKYILLWTIGYRYNSPFHLFEEGQKSFVDRNCTVKNCYITANRNYLNGDVTEFDYIFFNGRFMDRFTKADIPWNRSSHQYYVYFNLESSHNKPTCNSMYDNFFNLTSTYRLDSDIPFPYIQVKNIKGEVVGPNIEMNWIKGGVVDKDLAIKLKNKTKAVAWFVSRCQSENSREIYVNNLQEALKIYNLSVDIYGECGPFKCPRIDEKYCATMLSTDYYFYLTFENSFAVDYVTEKILRAMQHDVVPIVYGGANYSRFLPPGSYLNAREITPTELAATIADHMKSYEKYSKFFVWKSHYTYHDPVNIDNVCAVCEALNDKSMKPKQYKYFRHWWQPNYFKMCNLVHAPSY